MSNRFIKVYTADLRIGMYVVELDRPWLGTPFLVQGFVIKSIDELEVLAKLCRHVFVDTGRSKVFHKVQHHRSPSSRALTKDKLEETLNVRITKYEDTTTFHDELTIVDRFYKDYNAMVARLRDNISANRPIDVHDIHESASAIVDSIIRNPDACMLLARLKRKGDYSYNHALGCSIWAAALGRQLGLPKRVMVSLSIGALLLDVGKIRVPDTILNKIGELNGDELAQTRAHVDHSLEILASASGIDHIARQMVGVHHERHNGEGYPKGLKGKEISVYGRIAGIVDTYDALINDKPYRIGIAPSSAIRLLYNVRDVDFQGELVEEFIQALGVYPSGSVVELNNGQVGIVVTEHRNRRLRPKLLMLLDRDKTPLAEKTYLDLYTVSHDDTGKPLEIVRALEPGEYDLNPDTIVI